MEFRRVLLENEADIASLSTLASAIIKKHFDPIIGPAQNDYMIAKFQSVEAVTHQLAHGYQYYFVFHDSQQPVGFLAFFPRDNDMYLSKFYLAEEFRKRGLSRQMLAFVIEKARTAGLPSIVLNVNRNKPAVLAYNNSFYLLIVCFSASMDVLTPASTDMVRSSISSETSPS